MSVIRGHRCRIAGAGLLILICVACAGSSNPSVTTLGVQGRANANVSLAASGEFVAAAWSASEPGGSMDIYLSVSENGGDVFASPVRVNSTPGDARVNGEQPARVALIPRASATPAVVVVWTAKRAAGTVLLVARSDDGGRTFGESTVIPRTEAPGNRGWQALTVDPGGKVHVVWLDHRRLAADAKAETTHRHGTRAEPGSDTSDLAQLSDLYYTALDSPTAPVALTAGVCYCCKTATAASAGGDVHLAWRHVYPGNLRDIAFLTVRGGVPSDAPLRVSEDRWMLQGCPDDGPAMAIAADGRTHVVWPTVVTEAGDPQKVLFHASTIDGRTFSGRARLPVEGQANHPHIAVARDGTLLLAWDEVVRGSRRIAVARADAAANPATPVFHRVRLAGEHAGVYPVVAFTPTRSIVAWTSGAPAESTIAVLRMPAVH